MEKLHDARYAIDHRTMIDLWLSRAAVLELVGRNEEALRDLTTVRRIARSNGDKKIEADCLLQASDTLATVSKLEQIRDKASEALRLYGEIRDRMGQEECLTYIGFTHFKFGDYAAALEYLTRALELAEELGDQRGAATSLLAMGLVYGDLGEYPRSIDCSNRALTLRTASGDLRDQAACLVNLSQVYLQLLDTAAAHEHNARSFAMHRTVGDLRGQAINLSVFGTVCLEQGNRRDARAHLLNAERIADQINDKDLTRSIAVRRGEVELAEGNLALAASYADTAVMLSSELRSTMNIAAALLLRARIDAAGKDWRSAREEFERVLGMLRDIKLPYQIARAYYYYGLALREEERNDTGNGYLSQAREIFTKIGAMGWLKKCAALP